MAEPSYFCGLRGKPMSPQEIEMHHCLLRQKGRNRGKPCKYLMSL